MGYDVHITRKSEWFDREQLGISFDEWSSYLATDQSMRLEGVARTTSPAGDEIEIKGPGIAVWLEYSGHKDNKMAWFNLSRSGNVIVKNPDPEILQKMWQVAQVLGAKVQGDEGEVYDADGSVES